MSDHPHIALGDKSLPVYAQPFRRIVKRLGSVMDALRDSTDDAQGFDTEQFVGSLGDKLYETLVTFVPKLPEFLPEFEFNGYASPVAMKEDNYDEDNDPSPTLPQFIDAFDTIIEVNGGKRFLDMLGKVFDPKMLKAEMSLALSELREGLSTGSQNSSTTSTESLPSVSTTTARTPEASHGSSEIASLDFVPRREWMPERSGEPQMTSA